MYRMLHAQKIVYRLFSFFGTIKGDDTVHSTPEGSVRKGPKADVMRRTGGREVSVGRERGGVEEGWETKLCSSGYGNEWRWWEENEEFQCRRNCQPGRVVLHMHVVSLYQTE